MRRSGWFAGALPVLIVAAAALLRLWRLDTVPLGLHNDEAWTGINARQVLSEGWIGPYLYPSGLGQPAGPVYVTALLFTVLPQTVFTLRMSMALFGIATVALTFAAVRAMFDRTTAVFAALLLASMPWHLHLSRTAFMVGAWPCVEMAVMWALFRTRARPSPWRFAGVGVLIGLGVYTYNAYPLFVPVAAVPFAYDLAAASGRAARRRWLVDAGAAALTALWATTLMVHYAATHEEYFWHQHDVAVVNSDAWRDASWPGRAGILTARGTEWTKGLVVGGRPDDGDALGERGQPLLDPLTSAAALVGLLIAARGWRRPECGVLLAAVLVLPLGALLTIDDGLYRRTFGLAPFVATLAALPLARLWAHGRAARRPVRTAVGAAIGLVLAVAAARNTYAYFGPLQRGKQIPYVFPYQIDAAARAVAALPPDTVVYLYSDRWGVRFETIKWYAPLAPMVDRSREFRRDASVDAPLDLRADPTGPSAFVFLGNYLDTAAQVRARYPHATMQEEARNGEVLFRLVRVAPQHTP
jgi:4-amino-4-deoxy-L-arabinose transferase-like glycosyltransferase